MGLDDVDTDTILKEIETPATERPMGDEPGAAATPQPAAAEPPKWSGDEWAFDWNGKRVVPDSREKLQTWVQLDYNNSTRAAEINKREADLKAFEAKYKPYAEVDDYATKNPDWWQAVQDAYTKRGQQVPEQVNQLPPEMQAALKPLQEKLEAMSSFVTTVQQEKQIQDQQRQDEALTSEIEAIRKQHPTIDLNAVDESGKTLEYRVMAHAAEIGTGSFRAAFRDYLHDQLVESAKANSQTAQGKAKEHEKRQGILGVSPTPKKVPDDAPVNVRGRNYDQITQSILQEYGING